MTTFAGRALAFCKSLRGIELKVPGGVGVMNPFLEEQVIRITGQFFNKYFNDTGSRVFIFGINPGRFGSGVTGITFTDPVRLQHDCGIQNTLNPRPELSSVFIYEMISRYGGTVKFYSDFYMTALSPLGFIKDGRNLNYYDDRQLENAVKPFIIQSVRDQADFGCNRMTAICLGEGKNYTFFRKLNDEYGFFRRIVPLAHPRFIMQYRLRKKEDFIQKYLEVLGNA